MYTKNFPDSKNQIFKKFIALFQSIFAHSVQDKRCWNGKPFPKRNSVNSENVLVVLLLYIYILQLPTPPLRHSTLHCKCHPLCYLQIHIWKKRVEQLYSGTPKTKSHSGTKHENVFGFFLGGEYCIAWDDYLLLHIILDLQLHLA